MDNRVTKVAQGKTIGTDGPLLTVQEAAALLRVPESWLYARTRLNTIPYIRVGKYVRFDKHRLMTWLAAQQEVHW